jgi:ATP-binding cassette subfamily B protein
LVIDNGEIVAEGKHQDLIKKEGFYKEIFKKQQLEEN